MTTFILTSAAAVSLPLAIFFQHLSRTCKVCGSRPVAGNSLHRVNTTDHICTRCLTHPVAIFKENL